MKRATWKGKKGKSWKGKSYRQHYTP